MLQFSHAIFRFNMKRLFICVYSVFITIPPTDPHFFIHRTKDFLFLVIDAYLLSVNIVINMLEEIVMHVAKC